MKFQPVFVLRGLALLASALSLPAHADWATSTLARVVRPLPADSKIQPQNPPGFTWAMHLAKPASYVLEVARTDVAGVAPQVFTTDQTWYLPSAPLAPGRYSWRVRPSTTLEWSSPRAFQIEAAASKPFVVPDNATLKNAIIRRAHPRGLLPITAPASSWSAAMKAERKPVLDSLVAQVVRRFTSIPVYKDADWPISTSGALTAATNAQIATIRWAMLDLTRQFEASSLLWRVTGEQRFLTEAITRGNQLAALNPYGPTSYGNADQETRLIALALAKGVDFLAGDVNPTTRTAWLKSITDRTTVIYAAFNTSDGGIAQFPYDSHGAVAQGYLALISTLTLGDIPAASAWFDYSFRAYCHSIYSWSGPEGGFANGTSYGQHMALTSLSMWQALSAASGVNLFTKPWSDGFLSTFMHFQPPGATTHVFGDEHEQRPVQTELKGFASRFATPNAAWYVQNLIGDEDALTLLQAPWPLPVASAPMSAPPPNAAMYQSVGWVAMHSSMADRARTSVYFKSSPYGSFNHSHADQNGIVVSSGGRPLLIETGWYDWYGSPLWNDWYRTTKAHNALTFDGGKGQSVDGFDKQLSRNGKITAFATSAALDYTEGDATAAYDGLLTSAKRQIWYLRGQDAIVVRDTAASLTARIFEWNLHAPALMTVAADKTVVITNVDRSLCIRSATADTTFAKRLGAPAKAGTIEDHGVFTKPLATTAEFIMVLDVGCKKPSISLAATATGRVLKVGGATVTLPK